MGSRYGEVYAQWRADPQGFWAEAAEGIDWIRPPKTIFDAEAGVYGRWFPDATLQHLLQRRRPPCRRRPRRPGGDLSTTARSPRTKRRITYRELLDEVATLAAVLQRSRRRQGRPRHRLHADDPGGAGRHAGLRAHRRRAFGGVRRLRRQGAGDPHRRRRAEAGADRRAAASSPAASSQYKPLLDDAIGLAKHKPRGLRRPAAAAVEGDDDRRPRPRLGDAGRAPPWRRASAPTACRARRHRSALHPLHLRHDRHAQGRGARQRRLPGRAEMVDEQRSTASSPARPVWAASDIGWVVGHSYIVYAPLLHGCATVALRRQADRHAGRRRVLARHRGVQGRRAFFTAPTALRAVAQGGPARHAVCKHYRSAVVAHAVPRRRARRSRHRGLGRAGARRCR